MSTQTVLIRVRSDGTRVVTREVSDMGSAADKTAQSFGKLKGLIAGVVTGVVINQIKQLADAYTTMQNKLRLTTTDQANLNAVFLELQKVSSDTRSSLETNVSLYSRLALSTKDLGTSQAEVLQFTKSLNQAVKLSGATAVEAENAIIQLSQGLAIGALRGDELRWRDSR
jgi:phage-related minor tail protein